MASVRNFIEVWMWDGTGFQMVNCGLGASGARPKKNEIGEKGNVCGRHQKQGGAFSHDQGGGFLPPEGTKKAT